MRLTDEEFRELKTRVGDEVFSRAGTGDKEALTALEDVRDELLANRSRHQKTIQTQQAVDHFEKSGEFNWDIIRDKLDVNKLSNKTVDVARKNGYGLSKNWTGSRFYNIGSKKGLLNQIWRDSDMKVDDFYREVLKGPDSWMKSTVQDLIKEELGQELDIRREIIPKYGEQSDSVGQTKAQTFTEAQMRKQAEAKWEWFPKKMTRDESGQMVTTKKEFTRYLDHLKTHDPYTYQQMEALDSAEEKSDFLMQLKEQDVAMYKRLQEIQNQGGSPYADAELFDWFTRRGMINSPDLTLLEQATSGLKAGAKVVIDGVSGVPGLYKEIPFDLTRANLSYLLGVGLDIVGQDQAGDFFKDFSKRQYTEAGEILGATKRAIAGDFQIITEGAGALSKDALIWLNQNRDTPEGEEAYRKAKNEVHRRYMLKAMENQAMWESISFDLASKFWKTPQAMERLVLAGTIIFDPTNLVDVATVGTSKAAKEGIKATAKATSRGSVKALKGQVDDMVADLATKQQQAIRIGQKEGVGSAASKAAIEAAQSASKELAEVQAKFSSELLAVTREIEESALAGKEKLSGKAIAGLGKAGETVMDGVDWLINRTARAISHSDDVNPAVTGLTRAALVGATSTATLGLAGGVAVGIASGTPVLRSFFRDLQKIGAYTALGSRMAQAHRVLRQSDEVAGEVLRDPVSKPLQALLALTEIPASVLNLPGIRHASRVPASALSSTFSKDGLKSISIQAALGYIGSGGEIEGAFAGIGTGAMFTAGLGGLQSFLPVADKADAIRVGSQNARHFRKLLDGTPMGAEFNKLTHSQQVAVAWGMGGFPDMGLKVIRNPDQGGAWFNPATGEMTINLASKDWQGDYAKEISKHEFNHHLAVRPGVREKVFNTLLGDTFTGRAGALASPGNGGKLKGHLESFTLHEIQQLRSTGESDQAIAARLGLSESAIQSDGQHLTAEDMRRSDVWFEMSDDFSNWSNRYLDRIYRNSPEAYHSIVDNKTIRELTEYMVEEFFVEQGASKNSKGYDFGDIKRYRQAAWAKGLDKLYNSEQGKLMKAMQAGRLGAVLDKSGKIKSSIFGDIPAIAPIQAIFDGYAKDRSMGIKLNDEVAIGVQESMDVKGIDPDELDVKLKQWVASGTINVDPSTSIPRGVKVNPDGTWTVTNPNEAFRTGKEAEAEAKAFAQAIIEWAEDNSPPARTNPEVATDLENQSPPQTPEQTAAFGRIKKTLENPDTTKTQVQAEIQVERAQAQQPATQDYLRQLSETLNTIMPDDGEMAWRKTIDGKSLFVGRYMSDGLLDHLEQSGQWNPHQMEHLRGLNEHLRDNRHALPVTVMYQSATGREGKYKARKASERTVYVTGFEVTRQGNLNYRIWNLDKAIKNASSKFKSKIGKKLYGDDGDVGQLTTDIYTFFNNHANGRPGATGIGVEKRDFIRKALGLGEPKTGEGSGRIVNPFSHEVGQLKDGKEAVLNTYRIDRTNWIDFNNPRGRRTLDRPLTSREEGSGGAYQRIRENYFPGQLDSFEEWSAKQPAGLSEEVLKRGYRQYVETTPDPRYTDADYLKAVESGDMETAQKMVDAAAASKGLKVLYHGTTQKGYVDIWNSGKLKPKAEPAVYVTTDSDGAGYGDGTVLRIAIDEGKLQIDDEFPDGREDFRADVGYGGEIQIKSADPVTYDDSGNVIPLSERFNPRSDDIRYFPGVDNSITDTIASLYENDEVAAQTFSRATATGSGKLWEASTAIPRKRQRRILREYAEKNGLLKPLQEIGNNIDRDSLVKLLADRSKIFPYEDFPRLAKIMGLNEDSNESAFYKGTVEDGRYEVIGFGSESIVFHDNQTGRVIKLSHIINAGFPSDTQPYRLAPDVSSIGRLQLQSQNDFGSLQSIHDFANNLDSSVTLDGFSEDMAFMMIGQDFIDGKKPSINEIKEYLEYEGWQDYRSPGIIGGREDVNQQFYFHPEKKAILMDSHDGNFIKDKIDKIYPIDLPTRELTDKQLEQVQANNVRFFPGLDDPETKRAGFNFTVVSDRVPVIRDLYAAKDWEGLREINRAVISHALADIPRKKLKVSTQDIHGVWIGETEPTIRVEIEAKDEATLDQIRNRINALGAIFDQDEVHEFQLATVAGGQSFGVVPGQKDQLQPYARIFVEDPTNPGRKLDWSELEPYRAQTNLLGASFDGNEIFVYAVDGNDVAFRAEVKKLEKLIHHGNRSRIQKGTEHGAIRLRRAARDLGGPETFRYEEGVLSDGTASKEGQDRGLRSDLALRVLKFTGGRLLSPKDAKRSLFVGKDLTPKQVELQTRIADHFEQAPVNDMDRPIVRRAYQSLQKELVDQYKAIVEGMEIIGVPWRRKQNGEWIEGDIYPNSAEAIRDIRQNNRMEFLLTDPDAFGPQGEDFSGHPLLEDSGVEIRLQDAETGELKPYTANYNDVLRVVHDVIAHGLYADQFGPIGEEGAYRTHAVVTQDPLAIWALANETRNQNSWVNYGPQMRGKDGKLLNAGDPGYLPAPEREFAEQKAILLPIDDLLTGVPEIDQKVENLRAMLTPEEAMGSLAGVRSSDLRFAPGSDQGSLDTNGPDRQNLEQLSNRSQDFKKQAVAALKKRKAQQREQILNADGIDTNAVRALHSAYDYIDENLQKPIPSQKRGQADNREGIPDDEATRFSIRSWQAAEAIDVADQRTAIEISSGDNLIPLEIFTQEIDISSLQPVLEDPLEARSLISPLSRLFKVQSSGNISTDDILNAGTPGGNLRYIGQGQESLVFLDMERHRVIKLGRVDSTDWDFPLSNENPEEFRPFQLGASYGRNIDLHGIPDFAAIQSINDFARAFEQDIQFVGFLGEMDFMLFEQPAFTSILDEKGNPLKSTEDEIRAYMTDRGWVPLSPPMAAFWYHPQKQMTAADAHSGNFIKTETGIEPIDLKVQQLTPENAELLIQRYGIVLDN